MDQIRSPQSRATDSTEPNLSLHPFFRSSIRPPVLSSSLSVLFFKGVITLRIIPYIPSWSEKVKTLLIHDSKLFSINL